MTDRVNGVNARKSITATKLITANVVTIRHESGMAIEARPRNFTFRPSITSSRNINSIHLASNGRDGHGQIRWMISLHIFPQPRKCLIKEIAHIGWREANAVILSPIAKKSRCFVLRIKHIKELIRLNRRCPDIIFPVCQKQRRVYPIRIEQRRFLNVLRIVSIRSFCKIRTLRDRPIDRLFMFNAVISATCRVELREKNR